MTQLIKHAFEVSEVIELMDKVRVSETYLPSDYLSLQLDTARRTLRSSNMMEFSWNQWFLYSGKLVLNLIRKTRGLSIENFCDMLLLKHSKYGAEPLTNWGAVGVAIRIDSKFERYKNLHGKDDEDTLMDMLGYCVLGFIMTKKA